MVEAPLGGRRRFGVLEILTVEKNGFRRWMEVEERVWWRKMKVTVKRFRVERETLREAMKVR